MKKPLARAQFRQLCSLGLDPPAVVPALLSITHHLVGCAYNAFIWPGGPEAQSFSGRTCVLVSQPPSLFGYRYLGRLQSRRIDESFRRFNAVSDFVCMRGRYATASRYHSLGWPGSRNRTIACSVKSRSGGNLGQLMLVREVGAREFTPEDHASLAQLQPHLANALEPRRFSQDGFATVGAPGMMTLNPDATISHANLRARALLALIDESRSPFPGLAPSRFSKRLGEACHRAIGVSSSIPLVHSFDHRMQWGLFRVHCERLDPRTSFGCGVVLATIEHHEPIAMLRMRAMQAAKLSPRQMQVCLLLCDQRSLEEVACEAGVSRTTIKDHVKTIYQRFEVHTREGLRARLVRQAVPASPASTQATQLVVDTQMLNSIAAYRRIKSNDATIRDPQYGD